MESINELLASMGFGKNEVEVYMALCKVGKSSVLEISKMVKIHRSNTYEALNNLLDKGVIYKIDHPKKIFFARPPDALFRFIREKEMALREHVGLLERKGDVRRVESNIGLSNGVFALWEAIWRALEAERIDVFGIPADAPERLGPMLKDFHQERKQKKIHMRHIYNSESKRAAHLNRMRHTEAKTSRPEFDSSVCTILYGDAVCMFTWEEPITVIEIKDPAIARAYQRYFEVLWLNAVWPDSVEKRPPVRPVQ